MFLQIAFLFFLFTGFRGQFHAVVDITQWSSYIVRDGQDDLFTHTEQFLVLTVYPLSCACPSLSFLMSCRMIRNEMNSKEEAETITKTNSLKENLRLP